MGKNMLEIWVDNFINDKPNEIVLFVDIEYISVEEHINNDLRNKIEHIEKYNISRYKDNWKNIIIYKDNFKYNKEYSFNFKLDYSLSEDNNFFDIINKCVNRGIIYIKNIDDFIKVLKNLNDKNLYIDIEFTYIGKDKFEDVIKNKQDIENYVTKRRKELFKIYRDIMNINFDYLNEHILLFMQKNILTAKFAHHLYRISELDFYSTVSSVGSKIRKILEVRAKTINFKKINTITKTYEFRNFKAYDLNNIDQYYDYKIKIAKKLIKINKISVSEIVKIVELPLSKVQKLWDNEYSK